MNRKLLSSEKGFTFLAALFIMMIMGIMLGMMGETWSMIMRRDREEELLFRGKQIKDAIKRFNDVNDPTSPLRPWRTSGFSTRPIPVSGTEALSPQELSGPDNRQGVAAYQGPGQGNHRRGEFQRAGAAQAGEFP